MKSKLALCLLFVLAATAAFAQEPQNKIYSCFLTVGQGGGGSGADLGKLQVNGPETRTDYENKVITLQAVQQPFDPEPLFSVGVYEKTPDLLPVSFFSGYLESRNKMVFAAIGVPEKVGGKITQVYQIVCN